MLKDTLEIESLLWIVLQKLHKLKYTQKIKSCYLVDEVLGIEGNMIRNLQVNLCNPPIRSPIPTLILKWRCTHQELITKHAQTPQIHILVMLLPLHHLRWQIIKCPTKCHATGVGCMHGPSEIGDFEFAFEA